MTIFISIGIFLSIVLLVEGAFYTYHTHFSKKNNQVKRRLRGASVAAAAKAKAQEVEILRKRNVSGLPWLNQLVNGITSLSAIEKLLTQANSQMPLGVFVLLSAVSGCLGVVVVALQDGPALAMLGLAVVGGLIPYGVICWKRRKRFQDFQSQLPDALDLMARALRAGHAFTVGMKMVGDEFSDPIGPEINRAVEEISFGIEIPEALKNLSTRIECVDLKFFITALIVQRETGGNLSEIIEAISRLIRLRFELLGRVKALSAEGRLSAWILGALPFIIGGVLYMLNEEYMGILFTDPTGKLMLMSSFAIMGVGAYVMKGMINFKV